MPILHALFTNRHSAEQALASLKKEAIPLHGLLISERRSLSAGIDGTISTLVAGPDGQMQMNSATFHPDADQIPIMMELEVSPSDYIRAESLLYRWQPQNRQPGLNDLY